MITESEIGIMEACANRSYRELADWHCQLNGWEWPIELPDLEEPVLDFNSNPRRGALMRWIENRIGERVISRVWNKDMSDDEHEDFWLGQQGNKDAYNRYWRRVQEKVKRFVI